MAESQKPTEEISSNGDGLVAEPRPVYGPEIPQQKEFFKIPARFGHVPVAEEPLGYDKERRFEGHYPRIELPFQAVDVVKTGAERLGEVTELFPQGRNRLLFGDCLHGMRMLPSESIDLIYIDPPFFSGRNYNLLFGDRNEVRSFTDIWDGGMPGYLIWLNARLYEMKRLLKPTGSIYVHLDWHAVHYVKCEMDKIFGYENFGNEIVWRRSLPHGNQRLRYGQSHDTILLYFNGREPIWNESKGFKKSPRGQDGEWYDSGWELQYMRELELDPMVRRWTRHHGLRIPYRKWWGSNGYYEPDFLVEIQGGQKEIREVKGTHLRSEEHTS